jgi:hypothetical protein
VLIVAGTDVGNRYRFPGFGLHEELAFYVSAGLTPGEALATATVNAAHLLGDEDEWGTIREGLAADLVGLNANPSTISATPGPSATSYKAATWLTAPRFLFTESKARRGRHCGGHVKDPVYRVLEQQPQVEACCARLHHGLLESVVIKRLRYRPSCSLIGRDVVARHETERREQDERQHPCQDRHRFPSTSRALRASGEQAISRRRRRHAAHRFGGTSPRVT